MEVEEITREPRLGSAWVPSNETVGLRGLEKGLEFPDGHFGRESKVLCRLCPLEFLFLQSTDRERRVELRHKHLCLLHALQSLSLFLSVTFLRTR